MELRHLRYFVAVADELNFTRAAAKLHLAQPSLTRQIHNLEGELGVRLFNRTKSQIELTEEGQRFLVDAKRLVALSVESVKAVQRFSRGESGQLNLGYLFRFNFDLLPATLTSFSAVCPEIAVNLFDMPPGAQLRALGARKIDLGFIGLRPSESEATENLKWECVARHKVVVALPASHALARRKTVRLEDLQSLFFVTMSEEKHPGSREWLSKMCKTAGFAPKILQDVEVEAGLMTFVAEGLGVTLAREQMQNLPHPGVVFRALASPGTVDYWIAWHSENQSKALLTYIETVKKHAAT